MTRQYPRVVVHADNAQPSEQQFRALHERSLDLMLAWVLRPLHDADVDMEVLCEDRFFVVAGVTSRWAHCRRLAFSDLAQEPWVMFPAYFLIAAHFSRALRASGMEPPRESVTFFTGRLVPDHKTIADFRKDNGPAIRKVCAQFVALCREIGLLTKASVAIDGSKFKAVNNRDKNFTHAKMERRLAQIDESVARYLSQLDTADLQEPSEALAAKTAHLKDKLAKLASEMERLSAIEKAMLASPDQQISLTDPDSRSMATSGRGSGVVGYNVQVAVDTEHHLIVTHEVTNTGSDRSQLANIASQAKEVLGADHLDAVADRGYFNSPEILACDQAGITVTLPKPMTSGAKSEGRFGKQDFVYLPTEGVYRCPAGEKLSYRFTREEAGKTVHRYWTTACPRCPLKAQCTPGAQRRITRWEHEHLLEAVQQRLDANPQAMRVRRETVEHPFGTLKMRMGATHFLMKRLPKVATEMALHVLAYNLTRVMNIIGVKPLLAAIRA